MLDSLTLFDRRMDLMFYLSEVRVSSYERLSERYGIGNTTISRDIHFLVYSMKVPIETKRGPGGYVMIRGDWTALSRRLNSRELKLILDIIPKTAPEDREIWISMIGRFYSSMMERDLRDEFLL
ncbi:MAG: HTH domain-containing protein [Saccharofermentans sp.]|nr:HTH domain-containing protein [Saccharofermentans sp.]